MYVPTFSPPLALARLLAAFAATGLSTHHALAQDGDEGVAGSFTFDDDPLDQAEFEFNDARTLSAWATKDRVHFQVDMARPLEEGMFTCVNIYIDCDNNDATGLDGAELWLRGAVGSRFRPNAFTEADGASKALQIRHTTVSDVVTMQNADGGGNRQFRHRYDKLPPPEVEGETIRFSVPTKTIREFGGRYGSVIGFRPVVETSCSEQPLLMRITCNDDGMPIQVDGDASEWSTARITRDPPDELHEAARFLDLTSLRVDHGDGKVFVCLEMAAAGFNESFDDVGIDRRDRVTIYVQPLFPRYQSPVEAVLNWGESNQAGASFEESLSWRSAVSGNTIEFEIERRSGQTQFRVFAWSDLQRTDTIGIGQFFQLDWGKYQ